MFEGVVESPPVAQPSAGDVEVTPAGPALALLLDGVDVEALDEETLVEVVAAWQRQIALGELGAALAAAELSRRAAMNPRWRGPAPADECVAADELAMRLGWSKRAARRLVGDGRALENELCFVADAVVAGTVDGPRMRVLLDALRDEPYQLAWNVQAKVLPRAASRSVRQLRDDIERELLAVCPDETRRRHDSAFAKRRVDHPRRLPRGMAGVWAVLSAQDAARFDGTLEATARAARAAGDPRTLDQLRADSFVGLVDAATFVQIGGSPTAGVHGSPGDGAAAVPASGPGCAPVDWLDRVPAAPFDHPWRPGEPEPPDLLVPPGEAGPPEGQEPPDEPAPSWPTSSRVLGSPDGPESPDGPGVWDDRDAHRIDDGAHRVGDPGGPEVEAEAAAGGGSFARRSPPAPRIRVPRIQVNVTVALSTLMGLDDAPARLDGYGPLSAEQARALAMKGVWRRLVLDPLSGTVLDVGRTRYRPPADLADHVRARDARCAEPGCAIPAETCDLDHTEEFFADGSRGETSAANLGSLCHRANLLKTGGGFTLSQPEPGRFIWTTPAGLRYESRPGVDGAWRRLGRSPTCAPPGRATAPANEAVAAAN